MDIGENIKYLRELKGLSQFDMAERMSISQKTYSGIENKGNNITLENIHIIAGIFNISVKELYELDTKTVVNGRNIGNKATKARVAFSNGNALSTTHKMYEDLISTKDKLIEAMKEDLERLRQEKRNA